MSPMNIIDPNNVVGYVFYIDICCAYLGTVSRGLIRNALVLLGNRIPCWQRSRQARQCHCRQSERGTPIHDVSPVAS
jgi:hypothetical protein